MRSIWNGMIRFGLVYIPVKLFSATRGQELHFPYLHEKDFGRLKNKRICAKCGQEVDEDELIRGYEYEKGDYLPLAEEDFAKANAEATDILPILAFVNPEEINPIFFNKPYYLAPDERGESLYVLLREALKRTGKVGIAKLVFHEREHLAAIKPNGRTLMLDILYFADEISPPRGFALPKPHVQPDEAEVTLAEQLIESMLEPFRPEQYKNAHREALLDLINRRLEGEKVKIKPKRREVPREIVNLKATLEASIHKAEGMRRKALAA